LERSLVKRAKELGLALVPGVMTPSEVHQAREWGCRMVKLFPAITLGKDYWSRLAPPLGPLPFCIAAGGLAPADGIPWLEAGVDAVALGGSLAQGAAWEGLATLVEGLGGRVVSAL
jgi:2-dehydro-3-deoxyphosphogluconate aldolase/(4S)-4-hydroxy-2-oxoglutarate aldolase